MRSLALTLSATLLLTSCSPALISSAPVVAKASDDPLTPLDEQAVRELLAGVELELGDERSRTYAAQLRAADAIHQRNLAIMGAAFAFILGGAVGAVITYTLQDKTSHVTNP